MGKNSLKILAGLTIVLASTIGKAQNVGINVSGTLPSINAILDLNTGNNHNLGLIVPNVSLTALATFNPPIANAATAGDVGMMVYNTNAAVGSGVGYYYWNGATCQFAGSSIGGAGTLNYLARWTPNGTTLGVGITQDNGARVGIQTGAYGFAAGNLLQVTANGTDVSAILGTTPQNTGYGVQGINTSGTGTTSGLYGRSTSPTGFGIIGLDNTVNGIGIRGSTSATTGTSLGVEGFIGAVVAPTTPAGVYGSEAANTVNLSGVMGVSTATSVSAYGVWGSSTSTPGYGVYGTNSNPAGIAMYGINTAADAAP